MIDRNIFNILKTHILNKKTICLLIGARQTGKTTLLKLLKNHLDQQNKQNNYFTLEDPEILEICNSHPENIFKVVSKPDTNDISWVFIDEIQYLDNPSNFLKYLYDEYHENIRLIVSGSSSFYIDEKFTDSLAGRKRVYNLNTVSFKEFAAYRGFNNVDKLNKDYNFTLLEKRELNDLFEEYAIFGGYPEVVLEKQYSEKQEILSELVNSYIKKDALEAGVEKTEKYLHLMKFLAEQTGSLYNANELSNTLSLNRATVDSYFKIMQVSNHISAVKPFYNNIRKELTKMPKVYFKDSGLRNSIIRDFSSMDVRADKGVLLEQSAFRMLLDYNKEDDIQYWRTAAKQEVDFILQGKQAFEVKFSADKFKLSKYRAFQNAYPDIPLTCINRENINEIAL